MVDDAHLPGNRGIDGQSDQRAEPREDGEPFRALDARVDITGIIGDCPDAPRAPNASTNDKAEERAVPQRIAIASADTTNVRRAERFETIRLQDEFVVQQAFEPSTNLASVRVGHPDQLTDPYVFGERVERCGRRLC